MLGVCVSIFGVLAFSIGDSFFLVSSRIPRPFPWWAMVPGAGYIAVIKYGKRGVL